MNAATPTTLIDAIRFFSDPDTCLNFMVAIRWPDGVTCPTCGSTEVGFLKTRRLWKCKNRHAKQQFSAKVGTIFEDSPIGLDKWFTAMWLVANCKNGISQLRNRPRSERHAENRVVHGSSDSARDRDGQFREDEG